MAMPKDKTVLVLSDLHCGHLVGLTPPSRHAHYNGQNDTLLKLEEVRQKLWAEFSKMIKKVGPVHTLVINGDAIDGKGSRSGGTEQITTDMCQQADIAAEVIRFIKPKNLCMTYGTPYHTGLEEDFEGMVIKEVLSNGNRYKPKVAVIDSQLFLDVNGVVFNFKHHTGSSSVPYGRATAVAKENIWNMAWNDSSKGNIPRADIFIRSHVHYFGFSGDKNKLCMTTPALQGLGTKFGSRRCSGTVDWGFVVFNIDGKGNYTWRQEIPDVASEIQQVQTLNL